jgi:capsule polysaccharide export protein KpsC/LpsZ
LEKSKNRLVLYCHPEDLNFLVSNYYTLSVDFIREFGLPDDTFVKIHPDIGCYKKEIDLKFNGNTLGTVLIEDEKKNKIPTETIIDKIDFDRGLH